MRRVVTADIAEVQRCLDTFLAGATGHFPTRAPVASVDVDYRFVIPARFGGGAGAAAERNGARRPSSDAGPTGR